MSSLLMQFSRNQVVAFSESGQLNKKAILHWDVCQALKEGKTHEKIAEIYGLNDDSHVRYIQRRHCPECR